MLEIISTIASVISAFFQAADYYAGRKDSASKKSRQANRTREQVQITKAKISAITENLWRKSAIIRVALLVSIVIFAVLSVWATNELSRLSFPPAWSILLILIVISLMIIYVVIVSITWVLIDRELKYYPLEENALSVLRIVIGQSSWRDPFSKWFLQEAFRQMTESERAKGRK